MAELWTQREDTGPRAQVVSNGLDFDSDRGVAVLLGWPPLSSNPAQTWEWDGGSWVQVDDMGPSGGMVVFMPDRHALLAHSNVSGSKTWERKNEVWTQVADTGPMAVGLAYDQSRSRAVALAFDSTLSVFETWEWDGTAWTVVADSGPSGRNSLGLAYDAKNKVTVLFGGFDPNRRRPLATPGRGMGNGGSRCPTWDRPPHVPRIRLRRQSGTVAAFRRPGGYHPLWGYLDVGWQALAAGQ